MQCGSLSQTGKEMGQADVFLPISTKLLLQRIEMILKEPLPHLDPLYPSEVFANFPNVFLFSLITCKSFLRHAKNVTFWTGNIYQLTNYNVALEFLRVTADRNMYEHIKGPPLDLLIAAALIYDLYPTKGGLSGIYNWSEVILKCKLTMRLLPVRNLESIRTTIYYVHYASAAYTIDWLLQVMHIQCSKGKLPKQMSLFRHELLNNHPTFAALVKDAKEKNDSISVPPKSHPIYFWCLVAIFLYFSYCFYLILF